MPDVVRYHMVLTSVVGIPDTCSEVEQEENRRSVREGNQYRVW